MGFPVNPMNEAWGRASRISSEKPFFILSAFTSQCSSPYCDRWASSVITMIFSRSDSSPVPSSNFWMVVKMMPPVCKSFNLRTKSSRPPVLVSLPFSFRSKPTRCGSCRKNFWQPANCSYSCWSRSFRSVTTTMVQLGYS